MSIITDRDTGQPKGFAFIEMTDDAMAKQGARLFLQGFLGTPEASFYQISNEVIWTGSPVASDNGSQVAKPQASSEK